MSLYFLLLSACITDVESLFDRDGDGFGSVEGDCATCTDCDDDNPNVNVEEAELCDDGLDNDCDGVVDDFGVGSDGFFLDNDSDGFGAGDPLLACTPAEGHVSNDDDCNDDDVMVHPQAEERCNDIDDDCDGSVDDGVTLPQWYADSDSDSYGDPTVVVLSCSQPSGYVANDEDCDDTDATTYPDAEDIWYDGVDADCLGNSDFDADGDGHDSNQHGGGDCDDTNPAISPGVDEICDNGIDDNCSGTHTGCSAP